MSSTTSAASPLGQQTASDPAISNASRLDSDRTDGSGHPLGGTSQRPRWVQRVLGFVALTKPRIIELLLVETVPTMILAKRGWPGWTLVIVTVIGGTLAAGGAHAVNMVVDRDIDAKMQRTSSRPLVTGLIQPAEALVFAAVLEIVAFAMLWRWVNLLAAALAFSAFAFYVVVYTLWLKRRYASNIVIGGAAGAAPVLIGWAAVTNQLSPAAWLLFTLIFLWTPPHFWALAIRYREEYTAADVPMLPSVASERATTLRILAYTVACLATSAALIPVGDLGPVYAVLAGLAGAGFLGLAWRVHQAPTQRGAMKLFGFSITYVSIIFAAIAADPLIGLGWPS